MADVFQTVDERERMSGEEFAELYVKRRRPVLLKRALSGCSALSRWTLDYLRRCSGDMIVPLKSWNGAGIAMTHMRFHDYADQLERYESAMGDRGSNAAERPAYLHDIPLKSILPEVEAALEQFPNQYFPIWYRSMWSDFAQFFLGPAGSITPLHFDSLLTHNLFFQIVGRKRFVLIPAQQLKFCYPYKWRWCRVDVEQPDFDRYPDYRRAHAVEVVLEPGDGLYFPSGTLHHVRSLDLGLSFNVDWHTQESAAAGLVAVARGMPLRNFYYNALIASGLWLGAPAKQVYPYYRSYLDYVS
ncbi:cupin-like domain-containing protein [Methylocystis bryophila]|uniref:Transcription factor jumonji n=1 Tax=Methylocystis bryophila TaxID=655015 RepID=A0A1W6N2G4_9HYPH|nr:cupin-like domain-containing protein [Methylocystis bryophila]ARN83999.1 transcription factor jumonji [Methylocystis bryophila]BDV41016.1 hypothetical protein DSM21852_42700 [Methylocystis bryophila]